MNIKLQSILALIISFVVLSTLPSCTQKAPQLGVDPLDDVISAMTLEEKANLLIGTGRPGTPIRGEVYPERVPGAAGSTYAIDRLGIPSTVLADGPAGLRIKPLREKDSATYFATAFPVATALASSWNTDLIQQVGQAMGSEVKEYGVDVLLAPGMNIHRNPLCGRNFEYYSEDPLISGEMAAAMVNGVESNDVGTSIKHYVANNQEKNRRSVDARVSERAMREIYLRGFEIAVKKSQPWTVMSSYNRVNGAYTSARRDLLTDILRDEWGYTGIVMTDWGGGYEDRGPRNYSTDVVGQISTGNDLLMPGNDHQRNSIIENVNNGNLPMEAVDTDVKRILQMVLKSPIFNNYQYSNAPDLKRHAGIARQSGAEGIVLLKNDGNALPYTEKSKTIAAFGNTSYNFIAGGTGSGDVNEAYTVSLVEGLDNASFKIDEELKQLYTPHIDAVRQSGKLRDTAGRHITPDRLRELELSDDQLARKADSSELAIITIGRNSGEHADRKLEDDFNLDSDEVNLIKRVSEAFHAKGKKVVVILNVGGVIETSSWKDQVDGILLAWQPGQEGGNAVVDVFSGKVNPSGKLTMTFPVKYSDTPSANNFPGVPADDPTYVTYEEGVYVGYRYFDSFNVEPSYEFGHGLSYTGFDYRNLELSSEQFEGDLGASVTVKNIGDTAGKEIVQLYLSAPTNMIDKPTMELKAFAKTKLLAPGESQRLTLVLDTKKLASFIQEKNAWIAEKGTYKVMVGSSSRNIKLSDEFSLASDLLVEKTRPSLSLQKPINELKKP